MTKRRIFVFCRLNSTLCLLFTFRLSTTCMLFTSPLSARAELEACTSSTREVFSVAGLRTSGQSEPGLLVVCVFGGLGVDADAGFSTACLGAVDRLGSECEP